MNKYYSNNIVNYFTKRMQLTSPPYCVCSSIVFAGRSVIFYLGLGELIQYKVSVASRTEQASIQIAGPIYPNARDSTIGKYEE